jgi:mono/diheme cytochrome c family protein
MRRRALILVLPLLATAACGGDDVIQVGPTDGSADATIDVDLVSYLPVPATGSPLRKGYDAIVARKCADCHQSPDPNDGVLSGRATAIQGTTAYPKNLTPDPDTGMDAWDAPTIARALRKGVDDQGLPLCPPMPHFTDMADDEANGIALYLQSLPPVHHYIPDSVCPPLEPFDAGIDTGIDSGIDAAPPADGAAEGGEGGADAPVDAPADASIPDSPASG